MFLIDVSVKVTPYLFRARLFSGQADEQFCLCGSEYEMSTYVIYCTNSHIWGVFDMRAQEGREDVRSMKETMRCIVIYCGVKRTVTNCH